MRYVTLRIVPEGNALNEVEQEFADEPAVTRKTMHHIRMLDDGTGTLLCEFEGDADTASEILDDHPNVISYSVSEIGEGFYAYIHQIFPGDVGDLLEILQKHELIVDTPIEYLDDGSFVITVIGGNETIQEAFAEFPETVDLEVESTGQYLPEAERLFNELTERQQETLRTAREKGYFADPRGATYDEVADELGCSPETVGEHIRKAQETLFAEIVPD